jgi:hypothetical protein
MRTPFLCCACAIVLTLGVAACGADDMPRVKLSRERTGFVLHPGGMPFRPLGFNYDHDDAGRLLEDYWETEWATVEQDFAEMRELGANVVRVHLQFGRFMEAADKPNARALERLGELLKLAERTKLYLDITGLGCYHKADVQKWYAGLSEEDRWSAQSRFWEAVARRCASSPAVFCYDLMNEPVVSGGRRADGDWLGPAFGGKHFVQFITLDSRERPRPEIARAWIDQLATSVRKVDPERLVTVGLVDWSLDRPGLTSGFVPDKTCQSLDFLAVHLYPEAGKLDAAERTLRGFAIGKPLIVEETFPLKCSSRELSEFMGRTEKLSSGWLSFYWGRPTKELNSTGKLSDAILAEWLDVIAAKSGPAKSGPANK